jgi:hypothetical protein
VPLCHIYHLLTITLTYFLQNDPVIPAFPDLHLSPAAILKELSSYFQNFSSQTRLLTLPAPHEIPPRELQEYPFCKFFYVFVNWSDLGFDNVASIQSPKQMWLLSKKNSYSNKEVNTIKLNILGDVNIMTPMNCIHTCQVVSCFILLN